MDRLPAVFFLLCAEAALKFLCLRPRSFRLILSESAFGGLFRRRRRARNGRRINLSSLIWKLRRLSRSCVGRANRFQRLAKRALQPMGGFAPAERISFAF